jgi:uncharacterized protein
VLAGEWRLGLSRPGSGGTDTVQPARVSWGQRGALALIRAYKVLLSPLFAGSCRFLPSCSDYAAEAVRTHGVIRGTGLAAARLAKCHPLGGAGLDPVPARRRRA